MKNESRGYWFWGHLVHNKHILPTAALVAVGQSAGAATLSLNFDAQVSQVVTSGGGSTNAAVGQAAQVELRFDPETFVGVDGSISPIPLYTSESTVDIEGNASNFIRYTVGSETYQGPIEVIGLRNQSSDYTDGGNEDLVGFASESFATYPTGVGSEVGEKAYFFLSTFPSSSSSAQDPELISSEELSLFPVGLDATAASQGV